MTQTSDQTDVNLPNSEPAETQKGTPKFDVFARGVATGLVATVIVEAGKSAVGILAKNPLVVFGAGIATGYFAHKYRKEIILSTDKVTEQTKDFVVRQKNSFVEMLGESKES